jgi:hypothetical protein
MGNAGSRLNATRKTFTASSRSTNGPLETLSCSSGVKLPLIRSQARSMPAMATLTAGPASATHSS